MNISLKLIYQPIYSFSPKELFYYWNPPYLLDFISGKKFEQITSDLNLTSQESIAHCDILFWVIELIKAFNNEKKEAFTPEWIVIVDETILHKFYCCEK